MTNTRLTGNWKHKEMALLKSYEQLTRLGKLRRLRGLAENALAQHELDVREYDLIGTDTNLIYRVQTADQQQFALRVAQPGWRTLTDLQSEALSFRF